MNMIAESYINTYDELLSFCGKCKVEKDMCIEKIIMNFEAFEKIFKLEMKCHGSKLSRIFNKMKLNWDLGLFLIDNDVSHEIVYFFDDDSYKIHKKYNESKGERF